MMIDYLLGRFLRHLKTSRKLVHKILQLSLSPKLSYSDAKQGMANNTINCLLIKSLLTNI